jgi:hypothetical protein
LDPQREAAIRRSLVWNGISFLPLLAAIAWWLFATDHWAGMRGLLLAASGLMIGLGASSALFFPALNALSPTRRVLGMSLAKYTLVSILIAVAAAAVLAVLAVAVTQK